MGCTTSRTESEPNELILDNSDKKLGFQQHEAMQLEIEFVKLKAQVYLSEDQVSGLAAKLRVPFKNSSAAPNIERFYGNFQQELGYSYSHLLVMAILLSSGSSMNKITILFETHDPQHLKVMEIDTFTELVKHMVAVSVQYLPEFLDSNSLSLDEKDSVSKYVQKLRNHQQVAVTEIIKMFCHGKVPDKVSVDELQENVRDPAVGQLTRASGIRKFIGKLDPSN